MQLKKIKSPLNYTGNKYRILSQIQPYFPNKIGTMIDMFCGGATVGLNTECGHLIFIDNDQMVIGLLKFLAKNNFDVLLSKIEKIIKYYGLSNSYRYGYKFYSEKILDKNKNNGLKEYNSEGFYRLRNDYNKLKNKKTDKAFCMLYVLLLYGFNNDLRFNNKSEYNLPVGKTDLNKNNVLKLKCYIEKIRKISAEFICSDFASKVSAQAIETADFVYLDPPYLITDAVYNETSGWNEKMEKALLNLLDELIMKNKSFVLSNVLSKTGKINGPLFEWIEKNNGIIKVEDIDYHYRGASYNKKVRNGNEREIIVVYIAD